MLRTAPLFSSQTSASFVTSRGTGVFKNCKSRSCDRSWPFCATKKYVVAIQQHLPDTASTRIFLHSHCRFIVCLIRNLQTRVSAVMPGVLPGIAVSFSKSFGYTWPPRTPFYYRVLPHPSKFFVNILLDTV